MQNYLRISSLLSVLLIGAACQSGTHSSSTLRRDAQRKPVSLEGLALTIEFEKESYEVGEPVQMVTTLTNRGKRAKTVDAALATEYGTVSLFVTDPDGESRPFHPLSESHTIGARQELAAEAAIGVVERVFFGADGWTFPETGDYELHAEYREGDQSVAAPPVKLTITPGAASRVRELVSGGPSSIEAGKFMLWSAGDHLGAGIELLESIVREKPQSSASQGIRLALGRSLADGFADYTTGEPRMPQPERARSFLEPIRTELLSANERAHQSIALARCAMVEGDREAAQVQLDLARRELGAHPEHAALRALVEKLGSLPE